MLLAAVGAFEAAHVLDDAEHRYLHHIRHVHGLRDDHPYKILRRRDDYYPAYRQGLEHRQRHIARSGRHIDEHIVHVRPHHVRPELRDRARNDRAAPHNRLRLILEDEVDGHDLYPGVRRDGDKVLLSAGRVLVDAEGLRYRRACDVRVEHRAVVAAALHLGGHQARDKGLSDAALAADDGNDFLYARTLVKRFEKALRLAGSAGFSAGGAIMCAFAHINNLPFQFKLYMYSYYTRFAQIVKSIKFTASISSPHG